MLMKHAYSTLLDVDNEGKVVPDLAESYTVENETEWTFVLKDGIKFHDGSDCTARMWLPVSNGQKLSQEALIIRETLKQ